MFTYCDVTDLIRNAEQLEKLATIDAMTNLFNRRHFLALAEAEWGRCRRHHRPLSMLMIDIDHFKTVNDRYGHAVGDEAIVSIASACRESTRGEDLAGRLGGEEFAVLLPETDQAQAMTLAERIRERVANHSLTAHKARFSVTISIGVAAAAASMSGLGALLGAADQALYQAKSRRAQSHGPMVAAARRRVISNTAGQPLDHPRALSISTGQDIYAGVEARS